MFTIFLISFKDLTHDWRAAILNVFTVAAVVFSYLLISALSLTLGSLSSGAEISRNLVVIEGDIVDPSDATLGNEAIDAANAVSGDLVDGISPMIFRHLRINDRLVQLRAAEMDHWRDIHQLSLVRGNWPNGLGQVAVTEGAATALGGDIGRSVTIFGSEFDIVAVVDASGTSFATIWMDLEQAAALFGPERGYQLMVVEVARGRDSAVAREALLADARITPKYQVYYEDSYTHRNSQALRDLQTIAGVMSVIALLAIVLGSYNFTAMNIAEKSRQIGILRTVGFEPWFIRRMNVFEAAFQGVLGFFFGLAAANLFFITRESVGQMYVFGWPLSFDLELSNVLGGLGLTILFAIVGALLALRRNLSRAPAEWLQI